MVLLGGLELVAAGYIIHKHQQNKRDKQRLEEEAAALEEQQYRIFPQDGRHSRPEERPERRRRSHSRRRNSEDRYDPQNRPHSHDGKYRRRPSPSPRPKPILKPTNYSNPQLSQQAPPSYPAVFAAAVPPAAQHLAPPMQHQPQPQPQYQAQSYPQDVKYGWTDDHQQQQRPQHDPNSPPTGWPAEWQQSQGASSSSRTQQPRQTAEPSRGRPEENSRVRFSRPRHSPSVRSLSQSPPPSYRA